VIAKPIHAYYVAMFPTACPTYLHRIEVVSVASLVADIVVAVDIQEAL
jgi:hypothetical protein